MRLAAFSFCLLGQLSALDPNAIHKEMIEYLYSLPYVSEEDFCIAKYTETLSLYVASAESKGTTERRAEIVFALADFANSIIASPRHVIRSICEDLAEAGDAIHTVGRSEHLLDVVVMDTASSILKKTGIEMLAIPGFMEPDMQEEFRKLLNLSIYASPFRFLYLIEKQLSLDELRLVVEVLIDLHEQWDVHQLENPGTFIHYAPLRLLLNGITGYGDKESFLHLVELVRSTSVLTKVELEYQHHANRAQTSLKSEIADAMYGIRRSTPEKWEEITPILQRTNSILSWNDSEFVFQYLFDMLDGVSRGHVAYDIELSAVPLAAVTDDFESPIEELSSLILDNSVAGIRIRQGFINAFPRDLYDNTEAIISCIEAINRVIMEFGTSEQRMASLFLWIESLSRKFLYRNKAFTWLKHWIEFKTLFRGIDFNIDLNPFVADIGRVNTVKKIIEIDSFPSVSQISAPCLLETFLSYCFTEYTVDVSEVTPFVDIFERFHVDKVAWYRNRRYLRFPLENIMMSLLEKPGRRHLLGPLFGSLGANLNRAFISQNLTPIHFPQWLDKEVTGWFDTKKFDGYEAVDAFVASKLIPVRERIEATGEYTFKGYDLIYDLLYLTTSIKFHNVTNTLDRLDEMIDTVKTFVVSEDINNEAIWNGLHYLNYDLRFKIEYFENAYQKFRGLFP